MDNYAHMFNFGKCFSYGSMPTFVIYFDYLDLE